MLRLSKKRNPVPMKVSDNSQILREHVYDVGKTSYDASPTIKKTTSPISVEDTKTSRLQTEQWTHMHCTILQHSTLDRTTSNSPGSFGGKTLRELPVTSGPQEKPQPLPGVAAAFEIADEERSD